MSYNQNNIFAKIIRGEAKAEKIYEDEHVLCFKDIFPKAKIHVLIVPKKEYIDVYDFSKNASSIEKQNIFSAFKKVIKYFKIKESGCRIITNQGSDGRQEVPHLHFHLLGGEDLGSMINT